ncbi:hypothetical protein BASA82_000350 [Batrachochytrium salamandrivorans]|nr:hypothetical protein BASA81_002912 [Batrachochytrium salamandrivorans]KAH9262602.1 hypothetical protein BASA82_000350 [Batrachochytrium salamandrivorans]
MYGPWPSPPPCNTNSECVALLASQFPTQQGLGQFACFSALQSDQNFAGGCACNGMYGLGGPTCGEQTEATPGALALAIIPCVILALTVAWFLPTLVFVLSRVRGKNRVLKFNAVGVSYMATWLALVCLLISIVTHILLSLYSSPTVLTLHDVTHRIIIIVLGAAVLNLIAVIVELSITMKAISNIEKYRFRVIAFVLFTAISLTVTYLVTPPQVSAFIVLCFTSAFVFISYLAPAWVFIQITLVNKPANRWPTSKWMESTEPSSRAGLSRAHCL